MRAPMCTAMPPTFSPITSTSPVCRPARIVEPELRHFPRQGLRAAHRARRTVERREVAVARGVDLAAAEALELAPREAVELLQLLGPGAVADRRRALRGIDDVGEHHGGEHAVDAPARGARR